MEFGKKGKCIIFFVFFGVGKIMIVYYLLKVGLGLEFFVLVCSCEFCVNEIDGKDYYFFGLEGFKKKIYEDVFVEWEEVYKDNFYGILCFEFE